MADACMTAASRDDRNDPAQAALNWLIALEEAPERSDLRADLEAWIAASPAHRAAWDEARRAWDLVGEAGAVLASAAQETPALGLPGPPHRRWRVRPLAAAAAATALAACLLAYLLPAVLLRLEADVSTGLGETQQVVLSDGSRLHLGADSAATIDYSDDARRIQLLAGAVFVEVATDARRPFTVVADTLESSALGTAYEVRRLEGGTFVAVAQGTVSAEDQAAALSERLEAGGWLHVGHHGSGTRRGTTRAGLVAAWRSGRLAVNDWPLGDVVDTLRRYFHGSIVVLDDGLAARRVTGSYDLADPAAALRAAVYPYGGTVRELTPWILVVSSS